MNKKQYSRGKILATALILIIAAADFSRADDFSPPDWRGQDGTTYQQWTFSTSEKGPMSPDVVDNTYGNPQLRVVSTADWDNGAWPLVGQMDILIPNRPESLPCSYKEIWIQLTWQQADLDPFLWDQPFISLNTNPFYDKYEIVPVNMGTNDLGWIQTLFKINVWPNPYEEMITLKGDIVVDQIVVDTYCIPEPATISMLGLGFALCLKKNIRSHRSRSWR